MTKDKKTKLQIKQKPETEIQWYYKEPGILMYKIVKKRLLK